MEPETLTTNSDTHLLERIQKGDDAALVALLDKYKPLMMSIVRREVPAYAVEDVYLDARAAIVVRFRRNPHGIRAVDKWVKQVTRSKCLYFGRHLAKEQEAFAIATDLYRVAEEQESRRHLSRDMSDEEKAMAVIRKLGSKYIEVARLREQGLTFPEIGVRLNIPENTAKSRWRKIRQIVFKHFGVPFPPKNDKS